MLEYFIAYSAKTGSHEFGIEFNPNSPPATTSMLVN